MMAQSRHAIHDFKSTLPEHPGKKVIRRVA